MICYTREEAISWAKHFAHHEETDQIVGRFKNSPECWGFAAIDEPCRTAQLIDTLLIKQQLSEPTK